MICETCHGTGRDQEIRLVMRELVPERAEYTNYFPCGECGGTGLSYCCEGEPPRGGGQSCD
jgi:hypothetical protein